MGIGIGEVMLGSHDKKTEVNKNSVNMTMSSWI